MGKINQDPDADSILHTLFPALRDLIMEFINYREQQRKRRSKTAAPPSIRRFGELEKVIRLLLRVKKAAETIVFESEDERRIDALIKTDPEAREMVIKLYRMRRDLVIDDKSSPGHSAKKKPWLEMVSDPTSLLLGLHQELGGLITEFMEYTKRRSGSKNRLALPFIRTVADMQKVVRLCLLIEKATRKSAYALEDERRRGALFETSPEARAIDAELSRRKDSIVLDP